MPPSEFEEMDDNPEVPNNKPMTQSRKRLFSTFWIYGLINNVLYVIILSAAVDLVGADVPKGVVLLADVMPSFFVKLSAPFFVHRIPYGVRIWILVALSLVGMQCVAIAASIHMRLLGVVLASMSSGLGELTFLQLTHFYDPISMLAFSSGTGGAGLAGSFLYLVATTWLRLSIRGTIFASSLLPLIFFLAYYIIMPAPDPILASQSSAFAAKRPRYSPLNEDEEAGPSQTESDRESLSSRLSLPRTMPSWDQMLDSSGKTLQRLAPLFIPYMLPLMLVYIGEYIINQGISPTLLFPIEEMPFEEYRDAYVTYGSLYQRKFVIFCLIYLFITNV